MKELIYGGVHVCDCVNGRMKKEYGVCDVNYSCLYILYSHIHVYNDRMDL